jgi:hypothetical protein
MSWFDEKPTLGHGAEIFIGDGNPVATSEQFFEIPGHQDPEITDPKADKKQLLTNTMMAKQYLPGPLGDGSIKFTCVYERRRKTHQLLFSLHRTQTPRNFIFKARSGRAIKARCFVSSTHSVKTEEAETLTIELTIDGMVEELH